MSRTTRGLDLVDPSEVIGRLPKYKARRSWSLLCGRFFDSKVELLRGEELRFREIAGEIRELQYQPLWVLSYKPRVTYRADFAYWTGEGEYCIEDVKGMITRDSRTRIAWVQQKYGLHIRVLCREGSGWREVEL